jgi:hypothetical protein
MGEIAPCCTVSHTVSLVTAILQLHLLTKLTHALKQKSGTNCLPSFRGWPASHGLFIGLGGTKDAVESFFFSFWSNSDEELFWPRVWALTRAHGGAFYAKEHTQILDHIVSIFRHFESYLHFTLLSYRPKHSTAAWRRLSKQIQDILSREGTRSIHTNRQTIFVNCFSGRRGQCTGKQ